VGLEVEGGLWVVCAGGGVEGAGCGEGGEEGGAGSEVGCGEWE